MSRVLGMSDENLAVLAEIAAEYVRDPLWMLVCPPSVVGASEFLKWFHGINGCRETEPSEEDIRGFAAHIATHIAQWTTMWP